MRVRMEVTRRSGNWRLVMVMLTVMVMGVLMMK